MNVGAPEFCKKEKSPRARRKARGLKLYFAARAGYNRQMEFCYEDENGRLTDAGMFGDLDQANSPATQRATLKQLRKQGVSDEAIRRTWPGLAPLLDSPLP